MGLSIVILNYNDFKTTSTLLELIKDYEAISHIVVVDNKSTENDYERLLKYKSNKITVIQARDNRGYSAGNNVGIQWVIDNTDDEFIAISNGDVEFDELFMSSLIERMNKDNKLAVVTGLQYSPEGKLAGHPFWPEYTNKEYFSTQIHSLRVFYHLSHGTPDSNYAKKKMLSGRDFFEVGTVEGSLFVIRTEVIKEIGLLDEKVFIYREEDILAKKIKRLDMKIGVDATVKYKHYGAQTTSKVFSSKTKINHIYNSSIYYFNNYQSDNKLLQIFNYLLCNMLRIEETIVSNIKRKRQTNG